jgi:hypothetical protein
MGVVETFVLAVLESCDPPDLHLPSLLAWATMPSKRLIFFPLDLHTEVEFVQCLANLYLFIYFCGTGIWIWVLVVLG